MYWSMLLLSTLILSSYSVIMVMLGYDWGLRMVINISVQYNGGFLHYIIDPKLTRISCSVLANTIPDGILYCLGLFPSPRHHIVDPMLCPPS